MERGRPAHFENVDLMQDLIDEYFDLNNKPTISGLALYLGFESRQSFYDYEKRDNFSYTIKRARLMVEEYYEQSLSTKNCVGAIFALKNFGWRDKTEIEHSGNGLNINIIQDDGCSPITD